MDGDTPTALRSPISGTVNVATMPAVTFSPTSPITVKSLDACALYSLAFFIEQVSGTLPPVPLHADFTLAKPVILENISMDCGGRTIHVLLQVDGGPLGINGATGSAATADVGLLMGSTPISYNFTTAVKATGDSYLPVTQVGVPVNSALSFFLFPDTTTSGAQCNMNMVLRNLS